MTPTLRARIAQAIAALEEIASDEKIYLGHGNFKEEPLSSAECQRIARNALASLRPLASAPADQSDAGRNVVIEECAKIADESAHDWNVVFEQTGDRAAKDCRDESLQIAIDIRALTAAPAETVGQGERQ